MKILFVHSVADLYGASRSLLRLATKLRRDGNEVLIVISKDGPLRRELELVGVQVILHPWLAIVTRTGFRKLAAFAKLFLSVPVSVLRLCIIVRDFRPDIIHTNTSLIPSPGVVSRIMRVRHVWHIREIFADFPRGWLFHEWFMYLFADRIICVSEAVARQFHPFIAARKVTTIHNGISVDEFPTSSQHSGKALRSHFGLDGQLTVGTVARIKIGRKGQDVLVRAIAQLKKKYPRVRLLLIGSPFPGNEGHLEQLQIMISEYGLDKEVVFTGDVEDINAAYATLDISVVPSVLPEAFSGVVIESMAMGKPVVGTRIGGTVEQIEDGVTGFLVAADDPTGLANALDRLLSDSDLRKQLGSNGRRRFLELFEFKQFYDKILSVYLRLVNRTPDYESTNV